MGNIWWPLLTQVKNEHSAPIAAILASLHDKKHKFYKFQTIWANLIGKIETANIHIFSFLLSPPKQQASCAINFHWSLTTGPRGLPLIVKGSTMVQLVMLLPDTTRGEGSILTSGAICVGFACSTGPPVSSRIPKVYGFVVLLASVNCLSV